jgi:hypothetical protein
MERICHSDVIPLLHLRSEMEIMHHKLEYLCNGFCTEIIQAFSYMQNCNPAEIVNMCHPTNSNTEKDIHIQLSMLFLFFTKMLSKFTSWLCAGIVGKWFSWSWSFSELLWADSYHPWNCKMLAGKFSIQPLMPSILHSLFYEFCSEGSKELPAV